MFANAFQSGFISVFYSVGSNPLSLWDKSVKNGHIRRVVDDEVKSLVLEISGTNVATTYITCPIKARASLGIKLPFLVMVLKNMKKYFTFEIQIIDDKNIRRRFRVSNFQSTTKVRPFCTTMPIGLSPGWNQIQFNLADFTKRAYGTVYIETVRVQIHANARIRRIYFSDRLYADNEMPTEFKLFLPVPGTHKKGDPKKGGKDDKKPGKDAEIGTDGPMGEVKMVGEEIASAAPPATPIDESPRTDRAEPPAEAMVEEFTVSEVAESEPQEEVAPEVQEVEEAAPAEPAEEGAGDEAVSEAPEQAPADEAASEAPAETPAETDTEATEEPPAEATEED